MNVTTTPSVWQRTTFVIKQMTATMAPTNGTAVRALTIYLSCHQLRGVVRIQSNIQSVIDDVAILSIQAINFYLLSNRVESFYCYCNSIVFGYVLVRIVDFSGENVLLVNHMNTEIPVCSQNYDSSWNARICNDLGFGCVASMRIFPAKSQHLNSFINP